MRKEQAENKRVKKMRRLAIDPEKIFAKDTTHKVLLSKIYKKFLKLNNRKTTQLKMNDKYGGVGDPRPCPSIKILDSCPEMKIAQQELWSAREKL